MNTFNQANLAKNIELRTRRQTLCQELGDDKMIVTS